MKRKFLGLQVFAFLAGVAALVFSGAASADPPSRAARLGYTVGAVSFSPAGESDWVAATVNRPLSLGDRLWVDARSRAEIELGGTMIRLNADTGVSLLNLDDQITQLQLTQGTLKLRVRRLAPNQIVEVDTPNLALTVRQAGDYRIAVDPDGNATDVVVRQGRAEVLGNGASYTVEAGQAYRFDAPDLSTYDYLDLPYADEFDRWASDRDRAFDNSRSARYVSPDVIGYQDLDANGSWRVDASYGPVWTPSRVSVGWAPYRDGHWTWIDPWGWTWVDDAPWGFAVSHYGRWTHVRDAWAWVPGPVRAPAYYAPALVVFVGDEHFRLTVSSAQVGGVAWFPLAPREVYRPAYPVSRSYFENINRSNTAINVTVIHNSYNTTNLSQVVYVNRHVPGAVIAVPTSAFTQSRPVSRDMVRVPEATLARAPLAVIPHLAPTERSVRGAGGPGDKPPAHVFERPVVARSAPPPGHIGFAAQQPQLILRPGRPLDDAARRALKPAPAVPMPNVKLLAPEPLAPPQPQAVPRQGWPSTPVTRPPESRRGTQAQGKDQPRAQPGAPLSPAPQQRLPEPRPEAPQIAPSAPSPWHRTTPPQPATPPMPSPAPQVVPPAPPAQALPAPVAPAGPPRAAQPHAVPQQGAPAVPTPRPPDSRPWTQRPGNDPRRAQPGAAPSPAPLQRAPESRPVVPQVAPVIPAPPVAPAAQPVPQPRPQPQLASQPVQQPAQQPAPRKFAPAPHVAPAAKPAEPATPVAAPQPQSPPIQGAPGAQARGPRPRPADSEPKDADRDQPRRETEDRRQRRP